MSAVIAAVTLTFVTSLAQAQTGDVPPTDRASLLKWLQAGSYKAWPKESAPHRSMGPYQTLLVTHLNPPAISKHLFERLDPDFFKKAKELGGGFV